MTDFNIDTDYDLNDFQDNVDLTTRVRLITSMNPFMADDPTAIYQMAALPISTVELGRSSVALYGMTAADRLRAQLDSMGPIQQRSVFSQLSVAQQMALTTQGYKMPVDEMGVSDVLTNVLAVPAKAIGTVTSGLGQATKPVWQPALATLGWIGDRPAHVYRTIRTMEDDAQWRGLLGGILGAAAVALAVPTGGASLGTLAAIGMIGLGATAGAAGAAALFDPMDFGKAFMSSFNGERTFDRPSQARAETLLGDPRLASVAFEFADGSKRNIYDIAREVASAQQVRSDSPLAQTNQQINELRRIADQIATPNTAQHKQAYDSLLNLLKEPLFLEAVDTLQKGKISVGRDIADQFFDPDGSAHNWVSGAADALFVLSVDPLLMAGRVADAAKFARFGLEAQDGIVNADRFRKLSNEVKSVRRFHEKLAEAVDINDFETARRLMPGADQLWDQLRTHRDQLQIPVGEFKREHIVDYFTNTGKMDTILRGIGTARGQNRVMLRGFNQRNELWFELSQNVRSLTSGLTDAFLEKQIVQRVVESGDETLLGAIPEALRPAPLVADDLPALKTVANLEAAPKGGWQIAATDLGAAGDLAETVAAMLIRKADLDANDLDQMQRLREMVADGTFKPLAGQTESLTLAQRLQELAAPLADLDIADLSQRLSDDLGRIAINNDAAPLTRMVGRKLGDVMPKMSYSVGSIVQMASTMIPERGAIRFVGPEAPEDVRRAAELMRFAMMPEYMRRMWFDEIMKVDSGNLRARNLMSMFDNAMSIAGVRDLKGGEQLMDEVLTRISHSYAFGGADEITLASGRKVRVSPLLDDSADFLTMPTLTDLRQAVRATRTARLIGIMDMPVVDTFINRVWKPAILLRVAFIPRAAGEEWINFMLRAGWGSMAQNLGARYVGRYDAWLAAKAKAESLGMGPGALRISGDKMGLTESEFKLLQQGPLPAGFRRVERMLQYVNWGDPIVDRMTQFNLQMRNFLTPVSEGGQGAFNVADRIESGLAQLGGTARQAIGQGAARGTVIQQFGRLSPEMMRLNVSEYAESILMGNPASWRRMLAGGVDDSLVRASREWALRYQTHMLRDTSAIEAGHYDRPYNRDDAVELVRNVAGKERPVKIVALKTGMKRQDIDTDPLARRAAHSALARMVIDDEGGRRLGVEVLSRVLPSGVDVDTATDFVAVVDALPDPFTAEVVLALGRNHPREVLDTTFAQLARQDPMYRVLAGRLPTYGRITSKDVVTAASQLRGEIASLQTGGGTVVRRRALEAELKEAGVSLQRASGISVLALDRLISNEVDSYFDAIDRAHAVSTDVGEWAEQLANSRVTAPQLLETPGVASSAVSTSTAPAVRVPRIVVAGSRSISGPVAQRMRDHLRSTLGSTTPDLLISGGARGADSIAAEVADELGIAKQIEMADWTREGRAAGMRRNERMINMLQPGDEVWVYVDKPLQQSVGTADTVRRAQQRGLRVRIFNASGVPQVSTTAPIVDITRPTPQLRFYTSLDEAKTDGLEVLRSHWTNANSQERQTTNRFLGEQPGLARSNTVALYTVDPAVDDLAPLFETTLAQVASQPGQVFAGDFVDAVVDELIRLADTKQGLISKRDNVRDWVMSQVEARLFAGNTIGGRPVALAGSQGDNVGLPANAVLVPRSSRIERMIGRTNEFGQPLTPPPLSFLFADREVVRGLNEALYRSLSNAGLPVPSTTAIPVIRTGREVLQDRISAVMTPEGTSNILVAPVEGQGQAIMMPASLRGGVDGQVELWSAPTDFVASKRRMLEVEEPIDKWADVAEAQWQMMVGRLAKNQRELYRPRTRRVDEVDAAGNQTVSETARVFRYRPDGGFEPVPVGEVMTPDTTYFNEKFQQVELGDARYMEPVSFETGGDLMWSALGPMLQDGMDRMRGATRFRPKRELVTLNGRVEPSPDWVPVYRSNEAQLPSPADGGPQLIIGPRYEELKENVWDKIVRFGFDRVIGPSIDAIVRKPMSFHFFAQRYRMAERNYDTWLVDLDLRERAFQELNSVLGAGAYSPQQQQDVFNTIRAALQEDGMVGATQWTAGATRAWLRGHSGDELEEALDSALRTLRTRQGQAAANSAEAKRLTQLEKNVAVVRAQTGNQILTGIGQQGSVDEMLEFVASKVPAWAWRDPKTLRDQLFKAFKTDPTVPLLSAQASETVVAFRKNLDHARSLAGEYAAEAALRDIMPFVDSQKVRSQFAEYGRNLMPFWYAEENFLKRWGRTFIDNPAVVRKAQLTYQGLREVGIIRTDENGRDWFVYPGSGLLVEAIGKVWPGAPVASIGTMFQSPTDMMFPGMSERFGQPSFSPWVSVPLDLAGAHFPEVQKLERALLQDVGASRSWVQHLVPTTLSAGWEALTGDEDSSRRYASAMMAAAAHMEAAGQGLPANADPQERDAYLRRLREHARIIMVSQWLAGFTTPGPPQPIQGGETAAPFGLGVEDVGGLLNASYLTLVRELGIEQGTIQYLELNSDATLVGLFNPEAFTVGGTQSVSGAPMPTTQEALDFYNNNVEYLDSMKYAGPWLMPSPPRDPNMTSAYIFDQQVLNNLREGRTPDEFIDELKFKEASGMYFEQKRLYEEAADRAEIAGDTARAQALKDAWTQWAATWKGAHPVFDRMLSSTDNKVRRRETLRQMRTIVNDPLAPASDKLGPMSNLMSEWDRYQALLADYRQDGTYGGRASVEELKSNWSRFLDYFTGQYPELRSFVVSIMRPESDLD